MVPMLGIAHEVGDKHPMDRPTRRPLRQSLVEEWYSQRRCQRRVVITMSVRIRVAAAPNRLPSGSCHGHPSSGE